LATPALAVTGLDGVSGLPEAGTVSVTVTTSVLDLRSTASQ
jgi:hypothetical protein